MFLCIANKTADIRKLKRVFVRVLCCMHECPSDRSREEVHAVSGQQDPPLHAVIVEADETDRAPCSAGWFHLTQVDFNRLQHPPTAAVAAAVVVVDGGRSTDTAALQVAPWHQHRLAWFFRQDPQRKTHAVENFLSSCLGPWAFCKPVFDCVWFFTTPWTCGINCFIKRMVDSFSSKRHGLTVSAAAFLQLMCLNRGQSSFRSEGSERQTHAMLLLLLLLLMMMTMTMLARGRVIMGRTLRVRRAPIFARERLRCPTFLLKFVYM